MYKISHPSLLILAGFGFSSLTHGLPWDVPRECLMLFFQMLLKQHYRDLIY